MVDKWLTRGGMVVTVNHGSATSTSLTSGQTVEINPFMPSDQLESRMNLSYILE